MKNKTTLLPILIMVLTMSIPVNGDTFTGTGILTTGTFVSTKYTKIIWDTVPSNEFDMFSASVMKEGETLFTDMFGESSGTTYLYESGTFYLDVIAANLDSWTITTTPTNGEYLSDGDTTTGIGSSQSKLFECFVSCEISWTTTPANEFDIFSVYIQKPGAILWAGSFTGESGSTNLYDIGTFYFDVTAANLDSWSITLGITPADTSEDGTTTPADTTSTTEDTSETTETYLELIGMVAIIPLIWVRKKR